MSPNDLYCRPYRMGEWQWNGYYRSGARMIRVGSRSDYIK